jgi:hypothetical protein
MHKRLMVVFAAIAGLMFAAPAAHAQAVAHGYLEVCKRSATTNPVSGPFRFLIDGTTPVVVNTGGCSAPIQVTAGNHTVVEENTAWTEVTSIVTIPQDRLNSSNLAARTASVAVPPGDISNTTTVAYTDRAVTGTLEVCKSAQAGSGATGNATFTVTGPMGFSRTLTVPVGACSASFDVPAGDQTRVTETGPGAVNLVGVSTVRAGDLLESDLLRAIVRLRIRAGGVDQETIATFVNSTSRLKICKVAGAPSLNGTIYSFTANGDTVTAVAQPAPGGCVLVDRAFAGGTRVDIQEGIVPGTAVTDISVSNNRAVPGSTSLGDRKVSVILGSGETVVTYTNQPAAPGLLKVCKNAGAGVTLGRVFHFSVNGTGLDVPAGYCAIAGSFPFNSTATVTEDAVAGLAVNAESVLPLSQLVSTDLAGRIIRARIGAGVTEVAFTNATAGTPPTAPSTGSSGSSTTPAPETIPTESGGNSLTGTTPTPVVETPSSHRRANSCRLTVHLVRLSGFHPKNGLGSAKRVSHLGPVILEIRARGNAKVCNVVINQLGLHGKVLARTTKHLKVNRLYRIRLNHKVARVRTRITSSH